MQILAVVARSSPTKPDRMNKQTLGHFHTLRGIDRRFVAGVIENMQGAQVSELVVPKDQSRQPCECSNKDQSYHGLHLLPVDTQGKVFELGTSIGDTFEPEVASPNSPAVWPGLQVDAQTPKS